jgi:hypothetical protein
MPRVTVYVPEDLKTRMDAADKAADEAVNWSSVAQRAFHAEALLQTFKKGSRDMSHVIERLRASKERVEARDREFGHKQGRGWAEAAAEYDNLYRVANIPTSDVEAAALSELLKRAVGLDSQKWREFVDQYLGDTILSPTLIEGFIEGATEVFDEVEDKLSAQAQAVTKSAAAAEGLGAKQYPMREQFPTEAGWWDAICMQGGSMPELAKACGCSEKRLRSHLHYRTEIQKNKWRLVELADGGVKLVRW